MINFIIETILYYPISSIVIIIISITAMSFASIRLWKFFKVALISTSKIGKLKPGKVKIKGKVKAIDTIAGLKKKSYNPLPTLLKGRCLY